MIFLSFHYTILLKKFCRHHICEIQHQKNFTVFLSWPLLLFHFNERIQWLLLKTSLSCRGGGCLKSDPLWVSSYTRHTPGRQPTVWAGEVIMTLGWRAVSSDRVLETTSVTCISSWEGPVWKTRYFLAFVQSSRVTYHDTWYPNKATLWKEVQPSFGEKAQKNQKNPPDHHFKVNMVSSIADVLSDLEQATLLLWFPLSLATVSWGMMMYHLQSNTSINVLLTGFMKITKRV